MQVHYVEIVTPDVDATCAAYEQLHDVTFGEADPALGNARTVAFSNGGMVGVRAPMHESETPTTRSYLRVRDIDAAAAAAVQAGGEIALPPMELPGHGKIVVYIQGGVQHGLWQV